MTTIIKNLKNLNISLPKASPPLANYSPFIITHNLVYISGQIPIKDSEIINPGKLGKELNIQKGKEAAEICILNTFAILREITNDKLDQIKKCVKITVFINSTSDFCEQPAVADGASNLINDIMSPNGSHSRSAISCNSLPKNASIEIDSIFELFN